MTMRLLRILTGVVLAIAAVFAISPTDGPAAQGQPRVRAVNSLRDTAAFRLAGPTAEWTVERMASAQPMTVRAFDAIGVATRTLAGAQAQAQADGPPAFVRSASGGGGTRPVTLLSATPEPLSIDPGYNYPPPHTRYENFPKTLAQYREFPYRTVGRLFFTLPGFGDFVCSASSIGNYAVWTASHCVHSGGPGGVWATNFVFVPAWRDGTMPYGQFTGAYALSNTAWVNGSDLRYDYAAVILNKNTFGGNTRKVSQRVGSLGFAYNWPVLDVNSHWASIGYPAGAPFTGQRQQICQGSFAYYDTLLHLIGPFPIGMGCDQTGGTSGGPWIRQYAGNAGSANYLNGNQSYRLIIDGQLRTHELFSPYFDSTTKTVAYDCAVNSSPTVVDCVAPAQP